MENRKQNRYSRMITFVGLFLLVIFMGITYGLIKDLQKREVKIEESVAQEHVSQRLPTMLDDLKVARVKCRFTIDSIAVNFVNNNQVLLAIHGNLETAKGNVGVIAKWISALDYADQGFYFNLEHINYWDFKFFGNAEKKLKNEKFIEKLEISLKTVIQKKITTYLRENPAKKLDGFKGRVLGLAKDKVKIQGQMMTVNFSFLKLVGNAIVIVFIVIMVILSCIFAPILTGIGMIFS